MVGSGIRDILHTGLITRAAFDVEDSAAAAIGADEPLPFAGVAEAEGATADRARGHVTGADGTLDSLLRGEGVADGGELEGGVLGGFGH